MKIVFDQQIFAFQKYGGISRYFYEIASRICAISGNSVEIFAPIHVNEYFRKDGKIRPFGIKKPKKIRLTRVVKATNNFLSRLLLRRRTDVDIFHETYYSVSDHCPRSAKRIITVHDMIHEKFPQFFSVGLDEYSTEKAYAIRRADHVICVSQATKKDLVEILSIPEEKLSVIYHGSSLMLEKTGTASNSTVNENPYILYVGLRAGYKNFDRLLQAYRSSDYLMGKFDLVCFGGEALSQQELEIADSFDKKAGKLRMLQGDDEKLAQLYMSADVFVCPSLYEGFGIPVLEAMTLGCPVACADTGSTPEIAGNAAELFNPNDVSEIAAAITRILANPDYASKLIEKGRMRCRDFSWDKCASETLEVYRKVLEK